MRSHGVRATYSAGCRCNRCREANRVYNASVDRRLPANRNRSFKLPQVPLTPLLERLSSYLGAAIGEMNHDDMANACGVSRRTVDRWIATGTLRAQDADSIAVNLGWHPAAIWGADWYIRSALEEES
jgi:hypothetical protein